MSDVPAGDLPEPNDDSAPPEIDETEVDLDESEVDDGEVEPEAEPEEPGEAASGAQPATRRRGPRGEPFGAQLRRIEAERAREREEFRREIDALRNQPRQPTQAEIVEAERLERERFDLLSPYDQAVYLRNQMRAEVGRELEQTRNQIWRDADQRQYQEVLRTDPVVSAMNARTRQRIENTVEELARQPQARGVSRLLLLDLAIGRDVRENGAPARTRQQNQNGAAAGRAAASPSGARSDVAPARTRAGRDDIVDRLRDVRI